MLFLSQYYRMGAMTLVQTEKQLQDLVWKLTLIYKWI